MRVAHALAVGASLLVLSACSGGGDRDETTTPEPRVAGVVSVTTAEDGCEYAGPHSVRDARFTLETEKQSDGEASFHLLRLKRGVSFRELEAHIAREHERRASGRQTVGYESLAALEASTELLEDDQQALIAPQPNDLQPGTHAVLCIQASRLDLAGPLVLTP